MTSEKLKKLFVRYAEEAQFQRWSKGTPEVQFVYACEYGTIWKFTPIEWCNSLGKPSATRAITTFYYRERCGTVLSI
jgi:hypothetical protein